LPGVSRQVALIESSADKRLDDSLPADIEIPSGVIQLFQHGCGHVHVHALDRLNHAALTPKEFGNVLPSIGQPDRSLTVAAR